MTAADKVRAKMPTIIPVVLEEQGTPRTDVKVSLDGEPLIERITGLAVPVDVGLHELQFREGSDQKLLGSLKVLVLEGQRNRQVTLLLKRPKPT